MSDDVTFMLADYSLDSNDAMQSNRAILRISNAIFHRWERLRVSHCFRSDSHFMIYLLDAFEGILPIVHNNGDIHPSARGGNETMYSKSDNHNLNVKKHSLPAINSGFHNFKNGDRSFTTFKSPDTSSLSISPSGTKRSSTHSVEVACLESKRRRMSDSRSVQSAGSLYNKSMTISIDNNKNVRKRAIQQEAHECNVPVKSQTLDHDHLNGLHISDNSTETSDMQTVQPDSCQVTNTSISNSVCTLCHACFTSEDDIRSHLSSDHHIYRYMCVLCGCTNDEELIIYDHVHTQHPYLFRCTFNGCGYTSGRQVSVCDHVISQHGISGFSLVAEGFDTDKYYDKQQQYITVCLE